MWIRSQDLKILTEIHDLDIDGANQIWNGCSLLGKYSTEEKALKVLDEIQSAVGSAKVYSTNRASNGHSMSNEYVMVYQMPADEDVEA